MEKYLKYKVTDFLSDDSFIRSVIEPTPDDEAFWSRLIEDGLIDRNEYLTAYALIESFGAGKPVIPERLLDALWRRIHTTNKRNRKPIWVKSRAVIMYIAAVCLAGAAVLAVSLLSKPDRQLQENVRDLAWDYLVKKEMPSDHIQVVTGDVTLDVEGKEANVEYDGSGNVTVNTEAVNVKPANADQVYACQLRVPFGKRASLTLSDGSRLWINSGSTVFYPSDFADNKREIFIDGETYAEIAHDSERPFIVNTNAMIVRVLGTTFNLSAYHGETTERLTLVSGSVEVKPHNKQCVIVSPNQMMSYSEEKLTLENVDVENFISWRDGIYIFNNEPVENVLTRIARYYNVAMRLPASPSGITCSGKLVLKDDLQQQLNGLSRITSLRYVIADNNECYIMFEK